VGKRGLWTWTLGATAAAAGGWLIVAGSLTEAEAGCAALGGALCGFAVRRSMPERSAGDRLPVLYLFVTCSAREVDVNVHPAKTEVRFRFPRDLNELARHVLGGTEQVATLLAGGVFDRDRDKEFLEPGTPDDIRALAAAAKPRIAATMDCEDVQLIAG